MTLLLAAQIASPVDPAASKATSEFHPSAHAQDQALPAGVLGNLGALSMDSELSMNPDGGGKNIAQLNHDSDESAGNTDCDSNVSGLAYDVNSGERPEGFTMGIFASLEKVLETAKGAAAKPVLGFIKKYLRGTKLIFVLGQSGTGKTTIIREMTGQDLTIGHGPKSGTKNYRICPGIIHGEQYLFIDTAGFGAADMDDMDNFYDIRSYLDALAPLVTVAGVLFVCKSGGKRFMKQDLATIQWLKCFCGPEFYKYITIVSTQWDVFNPDYLEDSWNDFENILAEQAIQEVLDPAQAGSKRYHGGGVYHHGLKWSNDGNGDTPHAISPKKKPEERAKLIQAMIKERYSDTPKVKLQVFRELQQKIPWDETEAAEVLRKAHDPAKINLRVRDDFVRVARGIRAIPDETSTSSSDPSAWTLQTAERRAVLVSERTNTSSDQSAGAAPPPRRSWISRLLEWMQVANEAAEFFHQAREAAQEKKEASTGWWSGLWAGLWGSMSSFWTRPKSADNMASPR